MRFSRKTFSAEDHVRVDSPRIQGRFRQSIVAPLDHVAQQVEHAQVVGQQASARASSVVPTRSPGFQIPLVMRPAIRESCRSNETSRFPPGTHTPIPLVLAVDILPRRRTQCQCSSPPSYWPLMVRQVAWAQFFRCAKPVAIGRGHVPIHIGLRAVRGGTVFRLESVSSSHRSLRRKSLETIDGNFGQAAMANRRGISRRWKGRSRPA